VSCISSGMHTPVKSLQFRTNASKDGTGNEASAPSVLSIRHRFIDRIQVCLLRNSRLDSTAGCTSIYQPGLRLAGDRSSHQRTAPTLSFR
jgi:hypothetical protein